MASEKDEQVIFEKADKTSEVVSEKESNSLIIR